MNLIPDFWWGSFFRCSFLPLFSIFVKQATKITPSVFESINICTQLGSLREGMFRVILLSFLFYPISFFTSYQLIWFVSCWMFHSRLCYYWCKICCKYKHCTWSVTVALSWGTRWSCISLVGSMAALTNLLLRCKNSELLLRPKTLGFLLREWPLFKWINQGFRFIKS